MSSFMRKFFRKGFEIDLEDPLTYPSAETICKTIVKDQKKVEFITKEKPVIFKIEAEIYEAHIRMARGGYILFCREVR